MLGNSQVIEDYRQQIPINLGELEYVYVLVWGKTVKSQEVMTKSRKRTKGIGQLHDEVKKQVSLMLTPEAWQRLAVKAEERGLSRSEFIEQVARGLIPLVDNPSC